MKSLQDQLLNAGLIDKKKAKKITKASKKQKGQSLRNKEHSETEAQQEAKKELQQKKLRDQTLNKQQKEAAEEKAIAAQVIQIITLNKIDKRGGDVEFNFSDKKKIKKILLSNKLVNLITRGVLCVARCGESYEVIPRPVADKIRERDMDAVLVYNTPAKDCNAKADPEALSDEEYYAKFEIPDDLMW